MEFMPKKPSVSIIPLYAVIKGGEMWLLVKRKHGHVQHGNIVFQPLSSDSTILFSHFLFHCNKQGLLDCCCVRAAPQHSPTMFP